MEKLNNLYTFDEYSKNVDNIIGGYITERINEFEEIKKVINAKKED
jgi:ribosomal protein S17E